MNGWMIAVDGSAVNLAHVTQVLAEKRASHVDDTWYVIARPAGVCLATGLESREAAVTWIEARFRDAVDLTEDERRFLSMHANYESNKQDDFRYHHEDLAERARLKARWREIGDALHPDPWGNRDAVAS